jgi:hypothetical protein
MFFIFSFVNNTIEIIQKKVFFVHYRLIQLFIVSDVLLLVQKEISFFFISIVRIQNRSLQEHFPVGSK